MYLSRLLIILTLMFVASPVFAGQATYVDMRGKWESTKCTPPTTKNPSAPDSEAVADDLNAQIMMHNQFVSEARAYMECLADEANKDAKAMSYLATESAKQLIEKTQKEINDSSFHVKQKQEEDKSFF